MIKENNHRGLNKHHGHKRKRYDFRKKQPQRLKAVIKVNSRGVGYIRKPDLKEDIEIENYFLKFALNGDEVLYIVHPKIKNKPLQGEVVDVLKRAKNRFAGTLEKSGNYYFLNPDDRKMYKDIIIPEEPSIKTIVGKKCLAEIVSWSDYKKNPEGKIVKVFGNKGDHEAEIQSIIYDKGFESSFGTAIEKEAKKVNEQAQENFNREISHRKDLRNILTFTIDPADAKDFDDAISFRQIPNSKFQIPLYEVGIHIADVSYYVREGGLLDKEARERGFSIYLVDRTIPMLPEILSNNLCSLNPNEDKLDFSAIFQMNDRGQVLDQWFGKTIIRSQKRFSYEEAQKILDTKAGNSFKELDALNKIAKILKDERFERGAIDFDSDEVRFELDKTGYPVRIFRKERLETHKLIEEFMILANRRVAEFMSKPLKNQKSGFIYRIHDLPDKDKIKELSGFLRAVGYNLHIDQKGNVSSKDLNSLFKQIEGRAEESLIKTAAVRTMAKAVYSVQNSGHFGLALKYYTHFTSPIRRYADLLVHRVLDRQLNRKKFGTEDFVKYQKLASEMSEKEIKVTEAERESIKFKQVEYMKGQIGKTFEGIISGVSEWGIFVEELNTKSEGLIKLRDMTDDFYELDQKNYRLMGRKTKNKFQLGGKVKMKVKAADVERKLIDYELV